MPSNGRWRRLKIVAPLPLGKSREQEIAGGLKNALDRGENLAKAKQSFLNAGYKPEEVEAAVQKMPAMTSTVSQPVTAPSETEIPAAQAAQPQATQPGQPQAAKPLPTTTTNIPGQQQKLSKKFIIILVSSAALALIGAAILGIFWDKIF